MAVALDSDAVVGFLDRSDALHRAADDAVRELIQDERLVVSVVTYAEVLTGAKLGRHDEALVKGFFFEVISAIIPADTGIAGRAAELRASNRSLRMPDALIVATAELGDEVRLLVTGDRQLGKLPDLDCEARILRV